MLKLHKPPSLILVLVLRICSCSYHWCTDTLLRLFRLLLTAADFDYCVPETHKRISHSFLFPICIYI